jgi:ElaB/YqjD/DUF883 family membrane-anchored ribosome-binding protein
MDRTEYLAVVALFEDLLARVHSVHQEEAEYAKDKLNDIEHRLEKAIEAYREKANANRP